MRARFFAGMESVLGAAADTVSTPGGSDPVAVTIVAHDIGPVGGMERQIAELAVGLRVAGTAVTVIARTCELPPGAACASTACAAPAARSCSPIRGS